MARMGGLASEGDYALEDELLTPPVDPRTGRVGGVKGPPASAWATLPSVQAAAQAADATFGTARRAYDQGLTPEEEAQFGVNTAMMGLGASVPFVPKGAIGVFGAKPPPSKRDLRSGAEIIADNERKYFAEQQARAEAKAAAAQSRSAPTYEDNVRAITTSRQALVDHANKYGLSDSQVEELLHNLMDYRPLSTKMFKEFTALRSNPVSERVPGAGIESASKVNPSREQLMADPAYAYHGTNIERAYDILEAQKLRTYGPSYGTPDQFAWPDRSREKRSYWTSNPDVAKSFYPEEGAPALMRARRDAVPFRAESGTGDLYATKPVPEKYLEIYLGNGKWGRLAIGGGTLGALATQDQYQP
jgi:hypothetical protein